MDLIAGNYSDSSSSESDNDSELEDVKKEDNKGQEDIIPLPDFEIDSSGMGKSKQKIDPKVSVFRNEYVAEREEKKAVMEQHVQLSNAVISSVETQGKKLCWQFRKHGRCRQGHKCRFAHDNDLFNGAGTVPSKLNPALGSNYSAPLGYEHPEEEEEADGIPKKKKKKFGLPETLVPKAKVITIYKDHKKKERSFK